MSPGSLTLASRLTARTLELGSGAGFLDSYIPPADYLRGLPLSGHPAIYTRSRPWLGVFWVPNARRSTQGARIAQQGQGQSASHCVRQDEEY